MYKLRGNERNIPKEKRVVTCRGRNDNIFVKKDIGDGSRVASNGVEAFLMEQ